MKIPSFLHGIPFPVYRSLADCILGRADPIWFPGGDKFTPHCGVDALHPPEVNLTPQYMANYHMLDQQFHCCERIFLRINKIEKRNTLEWVDALCSAGELNTTIHLCGVKGEVRRFFFNGSKFLSALN